MAARPSEQYPGLYERVQMRQLFADSKTFADAEPRMAPERILEAYRKEAPDDAALRNFVERHFLPPVDGAAPPALHATSLAGHIAALWPALLRGPQLPQAGSSQLPFDQPQVVPGGRFREIYYWDSYFSLLGLVRDGHGDIAADMVEGFAGLISRYGHIPNGTRSYYLSRSQPPFFYRMVGLLSPQDPARAYAGQLQALRAEHRFWMDGEAGLAPGTAWRRVVRMSDGSLLNRYWDDLAAPRDESWREDVLLARTAKRDSAGLYRDLRAAAESGWDFSSRWLADPQRLDSIETTAIVPVDLNALLHGLEQAIAQGCAVVVDVACVDEYTARARQRRIAMDRHLWDARAQAFLDAWWQSGRRTGRLSAATLYPLFTGAATQAQAQGVAHTVRRQLLARGGLATTTQRTTQQWDRPNGWAPLQWVAVEGLEAYGEHALAAEIGRRWLHTVETSWRKEGRLVEKYDLDAHVPGGGGEYPLQDGFGWTNGVTRALLERYPPRGGIQVQKAGEKYVRQ
ncbi:alpha,alpha-trehalase TreF [Solimonas sp. K1W22B-7]|nr:alpha,alpha-trehalase TreF [Solimonas sp. K1W22B-7]